MARVSRDNPHFIDSSSPGGIIRLRRENIGEIGKWVDGDYWHLNRAFNGRSLFFGSGIDAFIDPAERFLVLRDAGVILLFDYRDGQTWHATAPWCKTGGFSGYFPTIGFDEHGVVFPWSLSERDGSLDDSLILGLGHSLDGFLSHWRPSPGEENEYSLRLKMKSSMLEEKKR